jgi:glycosyltransferase
MKDPKISIVTAVYNGFGYIEDNIVSVKNQNYPAVEHIIVDGGSTDGTVDIIKKYAGSYNLKWVSERDGGIYEAFNKGFRMATGDIYAWVDGDNYLRPGVLRAVADIFENGQWDIVCGDVEIVGPVGRLKIYRVPEISFRYALCKNTGGIPLQPGTFFKKEIYRKTGEFNTNYRLAADYDFWLRVLKDNPKIYRAPMVFGSYRRGNEAASQSTKGVLRGYREMLAIGAAFHRPWHGKMFLSMKYFLGLLSSYKKRILR